ncbi:MAG: hydroxyphenylacetyl-CoA thioesterase PaaI [Alphaproteobacteria bacterium]|nr:hydroxyphenylacetyl-CoA thioesterase PaaI [Alphaproteobacteria bacterium]
MAAARKRRARPSRTSADQALAERVGHGMYARDRAARMLGIQLDAIAPGVARMSMTVTRRMLNGHAICHGGIIFTLADTAFAYACNARNRLSVALRCDISFCRPARLGEVLTATAEERQLAGRTGVYDITVANAAGEDVALFRGTSYGTSGTVV